MKILFFIDSLYSGGKERRLVELLIGLKIYKNIKCELVLTRSYIHYKEVYELNIPIHIVERKGFKKDPRLFIEFYKISRSFKPDLIHVWGNMAAIYAIPTKVLQNIPMINNQIGDAPFKMRNGILSNKLTFPFSNLLIANSEAGLRAYKPSPNKSLVIYNGFNLKRLDNLENKEIVKENFGISADLIIAMVASFSKLKDYTTYIRAALLVLEKNRNINFLCVGAGNMKNYEVLVPQEFKRNIIFIDAQNDILSLMNICDIGVLSTFTEGISNAIMEFMALGKPVVATDGGGTNELVLDNKTGYLVKRKSEVDMSQKINLLISNRLLRLKFGEKGRERIKSEFGIDSMVNDFVEEYKKYEVV